MYYIFLGCPTFFRCGACPLAVMTSGHPAKKGFELRDMKSPAAFRADSFHLPYWCPNGQQPVISEQLSKMM